tara:strand:+ start:110 stop:376 length:267 start_codon:yes stop_codon:yes gene_type:complete
MNRKMRRQMQKQTGKKATEQMAEKVHQFSKLPQSCNSCQEPFDKQDKEMVQSWSVVVKQEVVRLFCPDCIKKTKEIIDEHQKTQPRRA